MASVRCERKSESFERANGRTRQLKGSTAVTHTYTYIALVARAHTATAQSHTDTHHALTHKLHPERSGLQQMIFDASKLTMGPVGRVPLCRNMC